MFRHPKFKSVRLSIEVTEEINALVEQMAAETFTSKSVIVRRALMMMNVVMENKKAGRRAGIVDAGQPLVADLSVI